MVHWARGDLGSLPKWKHKISTFLLKKEPPKLIYVFLRIIFIVRFWKWLVSIATKENYGKFRNNTIFAISFLLFEVER